MFTRWVLFAHCIVPGRSSLTVYKYRYAVAGSDAAGERDGDGAKGEGYSGGTNAYEMVSDVHQSPIAANASLRGTPCIRRTQSKQCNVMKYELEGGSKY